MSLCALGCPPVPNPLPLLAVVFVGGTYDPPYELYFRASPFEAMDVYSVRLGTLPVCLAQILSIAVLPPRQDSDDEALNKSIVAKLRESIYRCRQVAGVIAVIAPGHGSLDGFFGFEQHSPPSEFLV